MSTSLDSYLGVHRQALKVIAKRTEVLASNLANADTPNYKAQDIDFKKALTDASGGGQLGQLGMSATRQGHIATSTASGGTATQTQYRVPLAPSLDGNTVDTQVEQANFAQNSIRYQATLTFLNSKFRGLMTAITGQ